MLARGYIVRVHVANVLASASLLQRVIRKFLSRNKERIIQTGAARRIQVRGSVVRTQRGFVGR
jgi:hypothetical protein